METGWKDTLLPRIAAQLEGLITPLSEIASPHQGAGRQLAQWRSTHRWSATRRMRAAPLESERRNESRCRFRSPRRMTKPLKNTT